MRHTTILVALAACGGGDATEPDAPVATIDAAPRELVMESKLLLVGEVAEATLTGGPEDSATITLTAPVAKLDWNIHGHAGGQTQTVKEELGVMTASYVFTPPAQAEWSLLVRNKDTAPMTIQVTIALFGDLAWTDWQ